MECLQRAVRDDDPRGIDAVMLRDPFPQRLVPERVPIEERCGAVPLDRDPRAVRDLFDRQALRGGDTAGE